MKAPDETKPKPIIFHALTSFFACITTADYSQWRGHVAEQVAPPLMRTASNDVSPSRSERIDKRS